MYTMCNSSWCTLHNRHGIMHWSRAYYIDYSSKKPQDLVVFSSVPNLKLMSLTFASPSWNIHWYTYHTSYTYTILTPLPISHYTYMHIHPHTHTHAWIMHAHPHTHPYTPKHPLTPTQPPTHTPTYQFLQGIVSVLAVFQWTHLPAVIRHIRTQYPVTTLI